MYTQSINKCQFYANNNMLLDYLLNRKHNKRQFDAISLDCSQFIEQSNGVPLFKKIQNISTAFKKVKVRLKKNSTKNLNAVFDKQANNLRKRAVVCNHPKTTDGDAGDLFYVFPINGYSFMYNIEIMNSKTELNRSFNTLQMQLGDEELTNDIITELVKYTYVSDNLIAGLRARAEIIIYNVPYFYTIRADSIDYDELLTHI